MNRELGPVSGRSEHDLPAGVRDMILQIDPGNVYVDPSSGYLVVSLDKLAGRLRELLKKIRLKGSWAAVAGSFTVSLTTLGTLINSQFKASLFGIEPEVWMAIYVIIFISSTVFFLGSLGYTIAQFWLKMSPEKAIHNLIEELKQKTLNSLER